MLPVHGLDTDFGDIVIVINSHELGVHHDAHRALHVDGMAIKRADFLIECSAHDDADGSAIFCHHDAFHFLLGIEDFLYGLSINVGRYGGNLDHKWF